MATATLTFPSPFPTSVTLTALTRTDTGATVSGSVTPNGNGVYTISVTEPAAGLVYAFSLSVTWADGSTAFPSGTIQGTAPLAGIYGDLSDIDAEMGEFNRGVAADPDQSGSTQIITQHEQKAINFADAFINTRLSNAGMPTPMTTNLDILRIIFGKLGAWQLYRIRGLQDGDKGDDKFAEKYNWAERELMRLIRAAFINGTIGSTGIPQSIAPTVDVYGNPLVTTLTPLPRQLFPLGWNAWGFAW